MIDIAQFQERKNAWSTTHSLSVVLPIYNEEETIAATLADVLETLSTNVSDFEVILVNDGSSDRTAEILADFAATTPLVHIVTHERNQGYGAALVDGFAASTRELTLFMDSDGQFDIRDLPRLLSFIDDYDAVIGYRIQRQDTWMRKLNAWGWKQLIGITLGVQVRDIDCAFKLLRSDFLHRYAPQTRGAMINTELLYTLKRRGYRYREVGVQHLPRRGGRATGARLHVIARAIRELFIYTWQQRYQPALHVAATHFFH
ncbi:MAG TPA: glycosyltransferase family 2 protein [Ktedonobacteraceae bacterium]|nr:glycosyltransferase family 2 protein [Ktedonobacteraceae bacterium]